LRIAGKSFRGADVSEPFRPGNGRPSGDPTRVTADTPSFSALRAGTRLDRYVIDSVIAAGGFGITYLARHEALGDVCAIKEHFPRQFAVRSGTTGRVSPTDEATFRWALDRFLGEGRSLVRCKHPNVVAVKDVFEANGTAYLVLNFEDGMSLKSWLEALGRPPTQGELDRLLRPLLDALEYVHAQGLMHRDLAPDNILIRTGGDPVLIDFGAARHAIAERSQVISAVVKSGFSPPEQYTTDGRAQGPWTDIYALAATVYRAVTGNPPPEAVNRASGLEMPRLFDNVELQGRYRQNFLSAIDHALRLRTAERPQSIGAWRPNLIGASSDDTATQRPTHMARPPEPLPPRPEPRKPKRIATIAASIAGLMLLAGAGMAGKYMWDQRESQVRLRIESERRLTLARAEADAARIKREAEEAAREAERIRRKAEQDARDARDQAARRERDEAERRRREAEDEAERQRAAVFSFTVCNKSSKRASVAISHYSTEVGAWLVEGWSTVEVGDCRNIGTFKKGQFYFYAKCYSGSCYWGGNDIKLCVELPGPFKRINKTGYTCQSREQLAGFRSREVDGDFTWTLNN
jgi:serine/threonine protein kinase/uncharacterized membrane protein